MEIVAGAISLLAAVTVFTGASIVSGVVGSKIADMKQKEEVEQSKSIKEELDAIKSKDYNQNVHAHIK